MAKEIITEDWQKVVLKCIAEHKELSNEERMQMLTTHQKNRDCRIQISMPDIEENQRNYNILSGYISNKYNTAIVHFDVTHSDEIRNEVSAAGMDMTATWISIFEINHNLMVTRSSFKGAGDYLLETRKKFENIQVIIVLCATEVQEKFPQVVDFIYSTAEGIVVFLG